jgi:hypothetical protein
MIFFIDLVWIFFAWKSAKEEVAWSNPFRNLPVEHFSWNNKQALSRIAHRAGAFSVGILAVGFAFLGGMLERALGSTLMQQMISHAIILLNCLLIYWIVFDARFAKGINKSPFYLGDTAIMDIWLKQHLGENAGRKKIIIATVILVILHVIYLIWL